MARLHSFSDEAICAIMTRNSQPHRYGSSKQNQEAVRLIHEQYAIDRREQTELLTAALIEANPEPISAYRVLHRHNDKSGAGGPYSRRRQHHQEG
jgi:hypothetical protein